MEESDITGWLANLSLYLITMQDAIECNPEPFGMNETLVKWHRRLTRRALRLIDCILLSTNVREQRTSEKRLRKVLQEFEDLRKWYSPRFPVTRKTAKSKQNRARVTDISA